MGEGESVEGGSEKVGVRRMVAGSRRKMGEGGSERKGRSEEESGVSVTLTKLNSAACQSPSMNLQRQCVNFHH